MCYAVLKYSGNFRTRKNKHSTVARVFLNSIVFSMKCPLCFLEVKWMACALLFPISRKSCNPLVKFLRQQYPLRKEILTTSVHSHLREFVPLCREKYKISLAALLFISSSWNPFRCECECSGPVEFCPATKVWRISYMITYDWDKYWLWLA